jgi:Zn-dependent protease with chaperone function
MDPIPNAWTFGDTRIYITLTSGLVDMLTDEELDSVIAHECGHILCRHVLYHTVAEWVKSGLASLGILGSLAVPIEYALLYWSRKSELSADRAAAIVTSPEVVASVQARLSGGPSTITSKIDLNEWAKQADEYDRIQNSGLWNKTLQLSVIAGLDHPFAAVRVREILNWGESEQFRLIRKVSLLGAGSGKRCPNCDSHVDDDWLFCRKCGHKL